MTDTKSDGTTVKFLWLLFVVCSSLVLNASETDYYLNEGFDFANGRTLVSKVVEQNGESKTLWTRYAKDSGYSNVYQKYQLKHDAPLIGYVCGTGYQSNFFIRVQTYNRGWNFWRWKWYFCSDVPSVCWDGYLPMFDLLVFLQQNEVPPEIARDWYAGCVKRFNDRKALAKYITEVMVEYKKNPPQRAGHMSRKYRETLPKQFPDNFFADFQIGPDCISFKLKNEGVRFLVSRQNESRKTEYGESFSMKPGENLSLSDGRHVNLNFAFLPKSQLSEELQWLYRKTGYPGENVLAVTEYFDSKSLGRNQVEIRNFLILPYWKELETSSFRTIFLNIRQSPNYIVLSYHRPSSIMDGIPMRTNSYEDVLLRIKDALKKTLAETSPFMPTGSWNTPFLALTDRPGEKVFMQHFFEVKDVFSVEVTPSPGVRSYIETSIWGVEDRTMISYTKFAPNVTPEFKRKIQKILTPEFLLIPKK